MMNEGTIKDQGTIEELKRRLKVGYLLIIELSSSKL